MPTTEASAGSQRGSHYLRIVAIALGLNVVAWVGASMGPGALAVWPLVSLLGFFALGLVIGRWWALGVTSTFAVVHAIPVYFGLVHGYLSTLGEALWWAIAMLILTALTALGVLVRRAIGWLIARN